MNVGILFFLWEKPGQPANTIFCRDVLFIRELLQRTTALWWMNEVLHVLKMKYFIQELFGYFLIHLVDLFDLFHQLHLVHLYFI